MEISNIKESIISEFSSILFSCLVPCRAVPYRAQHGCSAGADPGLTVGGGGG